MPFHVLIYRHASHFSLGFLGCQWLLGDWNFFLGIFPPNNFRTQSLVCTHFHFYFLSNDVLFKIFWPLWHTCHIRRLTYMHMYRPTWFWGSVIHTRLSRLFFFFFPEQEFNPGFDFWGSVFLIELFWFMNNFLIFLVIKDDHVHYPPNPTLHPVPPISTLQPGTECHRLPSRYRAPPHCLPPPLRDV